MPDKTTINKLIDQAPLVLIICGVFVFLVAASSNFSIGANSLNVTDPYWRMSLAGLGLLLAGVGITLLVVENSGLFGAIKRKNKKELLKAKKREALLRFYKTLVYEILDRTNMRINFCGAQPFRELLLDYYCQLITDETRKTTRSYLNNVEDKVCWFWYPGDIVGFSYPPPIYSSKEGKNELERSILEVSESDAVVAFTGRGGTYNQLLRLYQMHRKNQKQKLGEQEADATKLAVDFDRKLFILLAWFGGTVETFIAENKTELQPILSRYAVLDPSKNLSDGPPDSLWYENDNPEKLAKKLVDELKNLLVEHPSPRISFMCSTTEEIGVFG